MKVKKMAEEQKIQDKKEEVVKSKKTRKLIPERFHKRIHIFDKKFSERMPTRKL